MKTVLLKYLDIKYHVKANVDVFCDASDFVDIWPISRLMKNIDIFWFADNRKKKQIALMPQYDRELKEI